MEGFTGCYWRVNIARQHCRKAAHELFISDDRIQFPPSIYIFLASICTTFLSKIFMTCCWNILGRAFHSAEGWHRSDKRTDLHCCPLYVVLLRYEKQLYEYDLTSATWSFTIGIVNLTWKVACSQEKSSVHWLGSLIPVPYVHKNDTECLMMSSKDHYNALPFEAVGC